MELAFNRQLSYASGNFGKSLLWTSLDYLLLFYLTEVVGISVSWAGVIILISLLWDATISPFVGYWIDHRANDGYHYGPFLRWAPIATGLSFMALFWLPSDQVAVNSTYLLAALLGFRTAYALLDVPHNALLAHMPLSSELRMRLAGMRFFFSSLGGLVIAVVVAPKFSDLERTQLSESLLIMASLASLVLCLTVWQSMRLSQMAIVERAHIPDKFGPLKFVRAIFRSRVAVLYLALAGLFAATTPLFAKLLPYLLNYVRHEVSLLPILLTMLTLGQLIAMPIWTVLLARYRYNKIGQISSFGLAISFVILFIAISSHAYSVAFATVLVGFFFGGSIQVIWGLSGSVADYIAKQSRLRVDGGVLSFLTLVQKASIGFGAVIAGVALDTSGFQSGVDQKSAVINTIQIVALIVPAIGALLVAIIYGRLTKALCQD